MAEHNQLVQSLFVPALPLRASDSHKGCFGSVAIVGGDKGMVGAVLLAARAAMLCGAGRVHAVFLAQDAPSIDLQHPEIMLRSSATFNQLKQLNSIVVGPGLGQSASATALLTLCLSHPSPILIDADGLNLISQHPHLTAILQQRKAQTVITPHPAEAARLLHTTVEDIQNNRTKSALALADRYQAICVLKGAGTICADTDGTWFLNTTGNPGLATGGTGDVLSGVIGSLIAQGLTAMQAAKLGVYVHGAAADALVESGIGPVGLTASEVAKEARNQINLLNGLAQKKSI